MTIKPSTVEIVLIVVIVMMFVIGLVSYPGMPEQMVSHWDSNGQANGSGSKLMGVFFFPVMMLVLLLLFFAIPRIDPLRENIRQFRTSYEKFVMIFFLIMTALYIDTLLWNAGIHLSMNSIVSGGLALIIYATGSLCENAKRNYFIGIRTPWTLNSDSVWQKTHKLGAKLFRAVGIVIAFGIILPQYMIWLLIIPLAGVVVFVMVYSYVEYEREQKSVRGRT
jgi:uncharacterized membrane protein